MSRQQANKTSKTNKQDDTFETTQFILKPMEMRKVYLGRFRQSDAPPRFIVTWQPHDAPHIVSFRDCLIKHSDGTYTLYRQFQNYDNRPCAVQIQRARRPGSGQAAQVDEL